MDPNAALAEIRQILARRSRLENMSPEQWLDDMDDLLDDQLRLLELVEGLDGWLSKGGFLPDAWTNGGPRL